MSKIVDNKKNIYVAGVVVGGLVLVGAGAYYFGVKQTQTQYGRSGNMIYENRDTDQSSGYNNEDQGWGMMGDRGMGNKGQGGMLKGSVTITKEGEITENEKTALKMALADELKAFTFYTNIIAKFGDVRPFTNIVQSEAQHISKLHAVYEAYDIDIPQITPEQVPVPATVAEACEMGVQAEIDNAAIYDKVMTMTDKQSIKDVFTFLANASINNHKVAFERCSGN